MHVYWCHSVGRRSLFPMPQVNSRWQCLFRWPLLFVCFLTCDFHSGSSAFVFCRAVLAACSRYFEAMFSGGLRESLDTDVNFRDSIHPEVLLWISLWTVRLACSGGSLFSVLFIKKTKISIYIILYSSTSALKALASFTQTLFFSAFPAQVLSI